MSPHPSRLLSPPPIVAIVGMICIVVSGTALYADDPLPPVGPYLAKADVAAGEKRARSCLACHSIEKGSPSKHGPNLWNIVNNEHAQAESFNYSEGLKTYRTEGRLWTDAMLNEFLFNPQRHAPGTKMAFGGIKDPQDRANVIAWLHTLSDNPVPLPKAR